MTSRHLFVYGTLRPGEVRWHHLERWVVGDGQTATVAGAVYDTGFDYPAAVFSSGSRSIDSDSLIHGRVYELDAASVEAAMAHLDEVEGAERGLYRRIEVDTSLGVSAWAYECGDPSLLHTRIASGDWLAR